MEPKFGKLLAYLLFLCSSSLSAQPVRVEYTEESKREFPPGTTKAVLIATPEHSWYETVGDSSIVEKMDNRSLPPEVLKRLSPESDIPTTIDTKRKWSKKYIRSIRYKCMTG